MSGHRSSGRGRARRSVEPAARRYPRTVRVNEVLHQVVAESLERLSDHDERFALLTVTAVRCDPDLRHAEVLLASLEEGERVALEEVRGRLQQAVAHEVRLKRTPQLTFAADPAVSGGARIEAILREIRAGAGSGSGSESGGGAGPGSGSGGGAGPDERPAP